MNRKDKIQLLKEIQAGKKSVYDLLPGRTFVWYNRLGVYSCKELDMVTDKEGFMKWKQASRPNDTVILIQYRLSSNSPRQINSEKDIDSEWDYNLTMDLSK